MTGNTPVVSIVSEEPSPAVQSLIVSARHLSEPGAFPVLIVSVAPKDAASCTLSSILSMAIICLQPIILVAYESPSQHPVGPGRRCDEVSKIN